MEIDRLKLEKAQKELEEERAALAKERVRVYASEKSSRAESGIGMTEVSNNVIMISKLTFPSRVRKSQKHQNPEEEDEEERK